MSSTQTPSGSAAYAAYNRHAEGASPTSALSAVRSQEAPTFALPGAKRNTQCESCKPREGKGRHYCDGARPTCGYCKRNGLKCEYAWNRKHVYCVATPSIPDQPEDSSSNQLRAPLTDNPQAGTIDSSQYALPHMRDTASYDQIPSEGGSQSIPARTSVSPITFSPVYSPASPEAEMYVDNTGWFYLFDKDGLVAFNAVQNARLRLSLSTLQRPDTSRVTDGEPSQ